MPGLGLEADQRDDRRRERKKKPPPRPRAQLTVGSSGDRGTAGAGVGIVSSSHLAGRQGSGRDLDRERSSDTLTLPPERNHPPKSTSFQSLTEHREQNQEDAALDLRECQHERVRSEALSSPERKPRRWRPASLDLNDSPGVDSNVLSPRLLLDGPRGVKKTSAALSGSRSGVFPSPATPSYGNGGEGMSYNKGWSSERVPLNSGRRIPFNNGRTLPFKWEDAEKWICSPVSGDGIGRSLVPPPHYRRPKSKSGPLGPPAGIGGPYMGNSPLVPCFDSGRVGGFTSESPFMAGVLVPDRGCCGSYSSGGSEGGGGGDEGRRSCSANAEPYIVRSTSIHGWLDAMIELSSSLPSSQGTDQDEKLDCCRQSSLIISPVALRKDVATQMSPEGSTYSSPKERPLFSSSSSALPIEDMESYLSKMEVRDVQVDGRVTVTRRSKKHIAQGSDKRSVNTIEWKKKTVEAKSSTWEIAETTRKCIPTHKREEAKISAWEKLQNAKAEAAMRKLEMKLEKKRSSSMDKILNKLRSAQTKAQVMRSAATASQVARTTKKLSYFRRTGQISSLSGCFTCHAF